MSVSLALLRTEGLFWVVCTNGLIVSHGALPTYCMARRGDIVHDVEAGALKLAEHIDSLAHQRRVSMQIQGSAPSGGSVTRDWFPPAGLPQRSRTAVSI